MAGRYGRAGQAGARIWLSRVGRRGGRALPSRRADAASAPNPATCPTTTRARHRVTGDGALVGGEVADDVSQRGGHAASVGGRRAHEPGVRTAGDGADSRISHAGGADACGRPQWQEHAISWRAGRPTIHANLDATAQSNQHPQPDEPARADGGAEPDGHPESNGDAYPSPNNDAYPDAKRISDADADACSQPDADLDPQSDGDSWLFTVANGRSRRDTHGGRDADASWHTDNRNTDARGFTNRGRDLSGKCGAPSGSIIAPRGRALHARQALDVEREIHQGMRYAGIGRRARSGPASRAFLAGPSLASAALILVGANRRGPTSLRIAESGPHDTMTLEMKRLDGELSGNPVARANRL